jgi:hypothetical protein
MQYEIVHARSAHKLAQAVSIRLKEGWQLAGGVETIVPSPEIAKAHVAGEPDPLMVWPGFYQAITKG